ALNSAYELELKATNEHAKNTQGIYGEMDQMMNDLKDSAEETKKYKQEVSKLNQNLAELNMVYGNMLSAMSVMSNS
ncbi:MAG: gliding motility protein GldL, partial [Bacteroidota bacterium]